MIWKGHGLISETAYDAIMAECVWDNESNKCQQLLNEAGNSIGNIDVYYLYNTCSDPALAKRGKRAPTGNSLLGRAIKAAVERAEAAGLGIDPNCFGTGPTLETWFNQAAVKSNFHVAPAIQWSLCSNNGTFNYNSDIADERTLIYPTLTQQAGIQVMIYNVSRRVPVRAHAAAPHPPSSLSCRVRPTCACRTRTTSGGRAP